MHKMLWKRFQKDVRGNVAISGAAGIVALVALGGVVVDYGMVLNQR